MPHVNLDLETENSFNNEMSIYAQLIDPEKMEELLGDSSKLSESVKKQFESLKSSAKLIKNSIYGSLDHPANANFDFASLYPSMLKGSEELFDFFDEMAEHNAMNECCE